jgi:hypothetical protein
MRDRNSCNAAPAPKDPFNESTSDLRYGSNRARKSAFVRDKRVGIYVNGNNAGKTTYHQSSPERGHTTKTNPKPFSIVHLTLYPSLSNPSCSFTPLPSMKASFTNTLIGEAGVTVRAEKEGVNDLDQRMRPPRSQSKFRSDQ